jgi:hypothetical protein
MQRLFCIPDQGDNKKDLEITINEMTIFELEELTTAFKTGE